MENKLKKCKNYNIQIQTNRLIFKKNAKKAKKSAI